eukprot:Amastigsp_a3329_6.p3 type:complete len:152 gc:universal Amastigsp_a3329_6:102-557(+)
MTKTRIATTTRGCRRANESCLCLSRSSWYRQYSRRNASSSSSPGSQSRTRSGNRALSAALRSLTRCGAAPFSFATNERMMRPRSLPNACWYSNATGDLDICTTKRARNSSCMRESAWKASSKANPIEVTKRAVTPWARLVCMWKCCRSATR